MKEIDINAEREEADTRAELIDPQLEAAGWGVVKGSRIFREYPIKAGYIKPGGIRESTLKADYVLIYKNRILAAIEAKSEKKEVTSGVAQAKEYAELLDLKTTYAANGKEIYQMCFQTGKEENIIGFPSPEELWKKTFSERNEWASYFDEVPLDNISGKREIRYYQDIAVNRVMEAIAENNNRILLTMATGTGKTYMASQISWKLFQSRWNLKKDRKRRPRILFLVDRKILADDALLGFGSFPDNSLKRIETKEIKKHGVVPKNAGVFFTLFQTFSSGPEKEPYFGQYPNDFFDFIIVDECHRGGANDEGRWREILEYFNPAVQLGLTATPKRDVNADTYSYFGEPVYNYSLNQGIQDGFLTPFKITNITTELDQYEYDSEDTIIDGEAEEGEVFEEKDFEKTIELEERNELRVELLLSNIQPNDKTLVFCKNIDHAGKIRDLINQKSNSTDPHYCVRVTSEDAEIGDRHLKRFQDNEQTIPTVITTSQKLSTGVDAKNIRNIALMRPVNSMIEFKQIIGRGTRVFDGKWFFTIIDFVGAYEKFNDDEWDGEPIPPEPGEPHIPRPPEEPIPDPDPDPDPEPKGKVKIKLRDGKIREIGFQVSAKFIVDGKLVGVEDFIRKVFNILHTPEIFESEEKLRNMWSNPITRNELIDTLDQAGCSKDYLEKLQEIINAKECDLFDVLEYIGYSKKLISRVERVRNAKDNIYTFLDAQQREFIDFVLQNYIRDGVDELDEAKLGDIIKLKYKSTKEARDEIGDLNNLRDIFIDFQKYLYLENTG